MSTDDKIFFELRGTGSVSPQLQAALREAGFQLVEGGTQGGTQGGGDEAASRVLDLLGQGAGIVEASGEIVWMNHGLATQAPETMRRFSDACVEAIGVWHRAKSVSISTMRSNFRSLGCWFDVVVTPLRSTKEGENEITGAVALLVDATATRQIHERLDSIDAAGTDLLSFDADQLRALNSAERLRLLEERVVGQTRSTLGFDHFEYRLTDRRSNQLELVFCSGLVPLGIGERLYAKSEGNGISGWVASTGEGVICGDVTQDARYVGGLPGARSALTVPLRLHDRIVGVFNAESNEANAFDDGDRIAAELYGRYVALGLNILDMLVAERVSTNRDVAATIQREAAGPIEAAVREARLLASSTGIDPQVRTSVERIIENLEKTDERIRNAATGTKTVLGIEQMLREGCIDVAFVGKSVLVVDDEETIRRTVELVLVQHGCEVLACTTGVSAIAAIRDRAHSGQFFDLVISDVRMPDANGYEVFRAAKDASKDTPVILMTGFGYDPHHSIVRSSQEGLHCFLFKPFQVSQLIDESRKCLSRV